MKTHLANPYLASLASVITLAFTLQAYAGDMFDTNGIAAGFGVTDGSTYDWLDAVGYWTPSASAGASEGTATTGAWIPGKSANFVGAGTGTTYTVRLSTDGSSNTNVANIAINVNASDASFSPPAAGNVTIGDIGDIGTLTTLAANSVGAQGGGTLTINNPISLGGTMNYRGGIVVINGVISGTSNISASNTTTYSSVGGGALTLTGANTYSGGTTVGTRSIQIGGGNEGTVGAITSSAIGTGALTLNGVGVLSSDGTTARTILNAVTISGPANLGNATNNGTLTFSAATNLGTGVRTINTLSDAQFDDIVNGTGGASRRLASAP